MNPDGAPAHFCASVRDWLDTAYPSHWIGSGGFYDHQDYQIPYHCIGSFKELMHRNVMTPQTDLVARLHATCTSVDTALLRRVQSSIPRRAQAYLDMHDGHFAHQPL
ncbi:uncharacterized protein TNCV_3416041 [Trichonephila clavipes]|nr:uncharacterized protein TNCV_3416041 [Trichonephila clavipes]